MASESLSKQIEQELVDELRERQPGERFPSEAELVNRYKVSRVTVREALAALEHKGLIIRRQGLGTFVNHNVLQIQTRMDESIEFSELIRASGHTPSVTGTQVSTGRPEAAIAERLNLAEGDEIVTLHKVFSADDVPVIYAVNVLPLQLIAREHRDSVIRDSLKTEPIYRFLAERCGQTVAYQIADVRSLSATDGVARHLGCKAGVSVLNIEEVGYNADNDPVFYSDEYYNTDVIGFKLVRKPG
ncbi:MAG: GntR family transcriptional regulator [Ardenticatenaceae bacterium]|nr:GntR family transcriptional regulator [Ardenticatenaceae bacterium]